MVTRTVAVPDRFEFLVRQHRFKQVESVEPSPRYKQNSNIYRAFLPELILGFLPR